MLTLLLLGVPAMASESSRQVRIHLLPLVALSEPVVRLGQIAAVETTDVNILRQLAALDISAAVPRVAGEPISRMKLAAQLRTKLGLRDEVVRFTGAEYVQVEREVSVLDCSQVQQLAEAALLKALTPSASRTDVSLIQSGCGQGLPDGSMRARDRPISVGAGQSRVTVWMDVYAGDTWLRVLPFTFAMSVWRKVAVARDRQSAGDPFSSDQIIWADLPDSELRGPNWSGTESGRLRWRRAIEAGRPITTAHLETLPDVRRGSAVDVVAETGQLRLEMSVRVLQDGRIGDRVWVRRENGSTQMLARVTGPGKIEVIK
ncbi:MAG: flagellar basal body P-ring formation protein FlgA [Betaproteobacteria bacterium]|nr:flagellar basal body P-ring formation protein FlgA [Betaproteobacteria bacterium]